MSDNRTEGPEVPDGLSLEEIEQVICPATGYAGYPAAVRARKLVDEVPKR